MKRVLYVLLCFASSPFFYWFDGSIVKDWGMRGETLAPVALETSSRRCKSTVFLFHNCSYRYIFDDVSKSQNYFFVSFGAPDHLIMLQSKNSGKITSNVGQEYLFNRIATLFLFPIIGLFAMVGKIGAPAPSRPSVEQRSPDETVSHQGYIPAQERVLASPQHQPIRRPVVARGAKPTFGRRQVT